MKKYFFSIILVFLFNISLFAQGNLYVIAKSGLNLRETASLTATPIQTIPFGEAVKWISTEYKKEVTVEGITGYIAKVSYNGKTGYMFDGFLAVNSPANPLIIKDKVVIIKETDALQLAKMTGTMSESDLGEAGSDIGYYRMIATDALDKYTVPHISTEMRFIQFMKNDGTSEVVDTYQSPEFDCFMFNGKTIKKASTVDFSAEEGQMPATIKFMK